MLDPKLIRSDLHAVAEQLKKRNFELDVEALESLEQKRKACQVETENLQQERNTRAKSIGKAKAAGEDIQPVVQVGPELALGDELARDVPPLVAKLGMRPMIGRETKFAGLERPGIALGVSAQQLGKLRRRRGALVGGHAGCGQEH